MTVRLLRVHSATRAISKPPIHITHSSFLLTPCISHGQFCTRRPIPPSGYSTNDQLSSTPLPIMSDPEQQPLPAGVQPSTTPPPGDATNNNYAFLVHSQKTLTQNLPPRVDNKALARQKRRRTRYFSPHLHLTPPLLRDSRAPSRYISLFTLLPDTCMTLFFLLFSFDC